MKFPSLGSLFARSDQHALSDHRPNSPSAVASEASDALCTQSAKKAVDEGLRRWRASIVPLDEPGGASERREKTLSTIGAAMRQAHLEQRRLQQHRRFRVALSAAALLVGLGGVVYAGIGYSTGSTASAAMNGAMQSGQARLSGQSGPVWIESSGPHGRVRQAALAAGATEALAVGERVITHAGGEAGLDVGVDTQVQLHEQSELLLARNDHSDKLLALSDGAIDVTVEPGLSNQSASNQNASNQSAAKRTVVVETPNATVVVHGTVFSVAVTRESGHSTTTVNVRRGVVAVLQNGVEQRRLRAGESWSSRARKDEPSPASGSAQALPTTDEPATASAHATPHGTQSPTAKSQSPTAKSHEAAALAAKEPKAAEVAHLDAAESTLEQENGLFRLAVDARNNGDDAGAVRRFEQLLATYPKSALAQEAKVERFRALKRMGRGRDAAREARRYLIEHGNGFAEDEARDVALTPGP